MYVYTPPLTYSAAALNTRATASGASALTWNTGQSNALPMSEQYRVERESLGFVVKPTWLFITTWTVYGLGLGGLMVRMMEFKKFF